MNDNDTQQTALFEVLPLFHANQGAAQRIVINQGGTSSGKTYSIMQLLFVKGMEKGGRIITVVGQDVPNLKKGAYRDAKTILNSSERLRLWYPTINESDRFIRCINGSLIEFTSYKDEQDARSGKRDIAFFNEANGISYEIFWQVSMRTREQVFLDYNPSARFWVHEKLIGKPDVLLIISDHRRNHFLSQEQHDMIEGIDDRQLWKVYARGLTGKIIGLIYNNWELCDDMPPMEERKMTAYGLDFGFTNDPSALIEVVLAHGELWLDEHIYKTGQTNPMLAEAMKNDGITMRNEIIADSAEPKSIAELNGLGLHVIPATKGQDSVKNGIDILSRYRWHITRRSLGLRKEVANYKWKEKDGGNTNVPVDAFNHALDAIRYVALKKLNIHPEKRGLTRRN